MANFVKVHQPVGSSECTHLCTAHLDPKMPNLLERSYRVLLSRERRGRDHCPSHSLQDFLDTAALGLPPGFLVCSAGSAATELKPSLVLSRSQTTLSRDDFL